MAEPYLVNPEWGDKSRFLLGLGLLLSHGKLGKCSFKIYSSLRIQEYHPNIDIEVVIAALIFHYFDFRIINIFLFSLKRST